MNNKNISIFVDNLGASQSSYYIITQLNELYRERQDKNIIVFYNDLQQFCVQPNFSVMHIVEGWDQKGVGIATSFSTVEKILRLPCLNPQIYYMCDLDFLRLYPKRYDIMQSIMRNKNLRLITRSKYHAALVENNFNRQVDCLIENFNINNILDYIENLQT